MKSIFRKIAFVLALAMVVTLFPVMSASAATKDNKYVRTKNATLFVGGDANGSYESCWATGKKAKALVKDEKYKSSYESSNESVASVSKYGEVTAVSVGKTTITATFTKKGEKDIVESFEVTVKKNAVKVEFEEEIQKKLTEDLTVGDKITLKAVQTSADGKNDVTDAAKFTVKNPEGEGNEVVTLDTKTGELTAVKAGKATVTVRSWQWSWDSTLKKNVSTPTTEEVSVEVTVKNAGLVSAKQTKWNTFEVTTGNAEVAKAIIDAFNFPTKYKYNERLIVNRESNLDGQLIKDLAVESMEKKSDDEPNVIVVKMAAPIEALSKYLATYDNNGEEEIVSFVGAEVKPSYLVIKTEEAVINQDWPIEVLVMTANNVDITDSPSITGTISVSAPASNDYLVDSTNNKILFWEKGKQATVTATYDMGWDWNKNEKIKDLTRTGNIKSVERITTITNQIDGFAVLGTAKGFDDVKKLSFSQSTIRLAVGDAYHLYAKYSTTTNKTDTAYLWGGNANEFTFESSNPNVVSVVSNSNILYPHNVGSASITVKKDEQLIGIAYINVSASRYLGEITEVNLSKTKLSDCGNDKITVTVKAKDQLGVEIAPMIKDITVMTNSVQSLLDTQYTLDSNGYHTNKATISALSTGCFNLTGIVPVIIRLTVSYGGVERPYQCSIRVKHVNATDPVAGYNFTLTTDKINTSVLSTNQTTQIELEQLDKDGFHIGMESSASITGIADLNETKKNGVYQDGFYALVSKENIPYSGWNSQRNMVHGATLSAVVSGSAVLATVSGGAIQNVSQPVPTGIYVVRIYQVKNSNAPLFIGSRVLTVESSLTFKVEPPTTTQVSAAIDNTLTGIAALKGVITITPSDKSVSPSIVGCKLTNTQAKNSYFVEEVIVEVTSGSSTVYYTVPVRYLFTR